MRALCRFRTSVESREGYDIARFALYFACERMQRRRSCSITRFAHPKKYNADKVSKVL